MRDVSGGDDAGCSVPVCALPGPRLGCPAHKRGASFTGALPCPQAQGIVHKRCPVRRRGSPATSGGPFHEPGPRARAAALSTTRATSSTRGGATGLTCRLLIAFPDALVWLPSLVAYSPPPSPSVTRGQAAAPRGKVSHLPLYGASAWRSGNGAWAGRLREVGRADLSARLGAGREDGLGHGGCLRCFGRRSSRRCESDVVRVRRGAGSSGDRTWA